MTERTRRGKLKKAREGKVIATNRPHYGFRYNDSRDNYVVVEEEMRVVARIFRMVGEEGASLLRVKRTLEREGIPSPNGKRIWGKFFIRECIKDDAYRAHTFQELEGLVEKGQMASEVATKLDPAKRYGVWWFNRHRTTTTQVAVQDGEGRKRYRRRTSYAPKPESEWIAVPVPDAGIPREWVDRAREAVAKNRSLSRNGGRAWELSGGIARCAECGWTMRTATVTSGNSPKVNLYYRCPQVYLNPGACSNRKSHRADRLEPLVWDYVSGVMKDPETLRDDLDRMIELRRRDTRGEPDKERKLWAEKLAEVDGKRARYQEMAAEALITFEELRARLAELNEARETAERELAALRGHEEYILALERERDALLDSLEAEAPEALDPLEPGERHHWYRLLRLEADVDKDGNVEVSWSGAPDGEGVCQNETLSPSPYLASSSP
ncbi:MAG TPA: recombinase zinc beta ribbon domain-containing protein [Rubrobacteraceae bacterium]|nr:recombinase zinc beta ribbon domain-containing protein [Rubrobacteraceae bacterium]